MLFLLILVLNGILNAQYLNGDHYEYEDYLDMHIPNEILYHDAIIPALVRSNEKLIDKQLNETIYENTRDSLSSLLSLDLNIGDNLLNLNPSLALNENSNFENDNILKFALKNIQQNNDSSLKEVSINFIKSLKKLLKKFKKSKTYLNDISSHFIDYLKNYLAKIGNKNFEGRYKISYKSIKNIIKFLKKAEMIKSESETKEKKMIPFINAKFLDKIIEDRLNTTNETDNIQETTETALTTQSINEETNSEDEK